MLPQKGRGLSTAVDKIPFIWYNKKAGTPDNLWKGVDRMGLLEFVASVIASVVAYYVCKWLDGDE